MNIAFVYTNTDHQLDNYFPWRGKIIFDALNKDKFHSVDLIDSKDFVKRGSNLIKQLKTKQIIVIEGSPEINLLENINFWKSRGKVVVVDLPLEKDLIFENTKIIKSPVSMFAEHIKTHSKKVATEIEKIQSFQWGIHLADALILSSPLQQVNWQYSAPIQIIPEYIEVDRLVDLIKIPHEEFNIGLFLNQDIDPNDPIITFANNFSRSFNQVRWYPIINGQIKDRSGFNEKTLGKLSYEICNEWPQILSILDLGWIYSPNFKNTSSRIPLELMAKRIPWISNDSKYYQDIAEYGLFIQDENNWMLALSDIIKNIDIYRSNIVEVSYLYSLSRNIDDHIHEIIHMVSGLIKFSNQ